MPNKPLEIKPYATYSVKQVCRWLGCGRKAVYKMVGRGLPVLKEGHGYRFLGQHLLDWPRPDTERMTQ